MPYVAAMRGELAKAFELTCTEVFPPAGDSPCVKMANNYCPRFKGIYENNN